MVAPRQEAEQTSRRAQSNLALAARPKRRRAGATALGGGSSVGG